MAKNMENLQSETFRYERKFFVENIDRKVVESYIFNHDSFFSEIYHERMVNNIYFDYPLLNNFIDNIEGNVHRIKYRIRWYGDLYSKIKKPTLELKIKKGLVGTKKSILLTPFEIKKGVDSSHFKNAVLDSDVDPMVKHNVDLQDPLILNRYRRRYFQTANKKFRITIDDQQSFFKIKRFDNNFLEKHEDHSNVIIELKYDKQFDAEASKITSKLPFRVTKSSKYSRAIEALYL